VKMEDPYLGMLRNDPYSDYIYYGSKSTFQLNL